MGMFHQPSRDAGLPLPEPQVFAQLTNQRKANKIVSTFQVRCLRNPFAA